MSNRFASGDSGRVRTAFPAGHCRTPYYCRGKTGIVTRHCGDFRNPEELAYGAYDGPLTPMYRVRFAQIDLWLDYDGPAQDKCEIEIYQHWLVPDEGARS